MNNKRVIIAGGSGFIGRYLAEHFAKNFEVVVLSRAKTNAVNNGYKQGAQQQASRQNIRTVKWDGESQGGWADEIDGSELVINLCGKSVNCRYTSANREAILESRIRSTLAIGEAIRGCKRPPALWINAASATIYRHANDRPQDEASGEIENDFSVQVCKQWEATFFEQVTNGTRKVALRIAVTLGPGGVMIPYFNLLKWGLGGRQGSGKQMYSWVHIEDVAGVIEFLTGNPQLDGVYNVCSPKPVSNATFMKTLRQVTGHAIGLPAFEWMLKIGAVLIGTETELLLKSRWVVPTRLLQAGYHFKFNELSAAFKQIVSQSCRKQYHLF
ncbi:TIGR01777 family protein [Segetibacter sp. 3557_3]|uniref:TIGR01777 family oxidoreductase n=1 Tax=Segetibacter sp. 3557_3 TaxID=2547429 RepID=UPI00105914D5|nr:TIGR01777 family oxidoreductase [Segetibacter sp. 3557_3]TDH23003.1 TIGR01777 family protein [Segetibacter sp. 3557_3]